MKGGGVSVENRKILNTTLGVEILARIIFNEFREFWSFREDNAFAVKIREDKF